MHGVDRKRKGYRVGRGQDKHKGQGGESISYLCAAEATLGSPGELPSLVRPPEGCPTPVLCPQFAAVAIKGKGVPRQEAGHRPLTSSPGPEQGKGIHFQGARGGEHMTSDFKAV